MDFKLSYTKNIITTRENELEDTIIHALQKQDYKNIPYLLSLNPDFKYIFNVLGETSSSEAFIYLSILTGEELNSAFEYAEMIRSKDDIIKLYKIMEEKLSKKEVDRIVNETITSMLIDDRQPDGDPVLREELEFCLNFMVSKYINRVEDVAETFYLSKILDIKLYMEYLDKNTMKCEDYVINDLLDRGLPMEYLLNITTDYSMERYHEIEKIHDSIKDVLDIHLITELIDVINTYIID